MTKEEIKASIAANIAGQFNQIDISGKLAGILEGIVDAIPEGPKVLDVNDFDNRMIELTEQEYDEYLKNVHHIELENAFETGGHLFELTPSSSLIAQTAGSVAGVVEDNNALIKKVFGSEAISVKDNLIGFADYIALVNYDNSEKYALVYVNYEL